MTAAHWALTLFGAALLAIAWIAGWQIGDLTPPAVGTAAGLIAGLALFYFLGRSRGGAR